MRPTDELVGCVVTAHVLSKRHQLALPVEERRRVQPARRLEKALCLPKLLRQRVDLLWRYLRSRRYHGAAAQLQLLQARLAAHPAGARGVEVALQRPGVVRMAAPELHIHYVVLLLGVDVDAVADP